MWPFKKRKPKPITELADKWYAQLEVIREEMCKKQGICTHPAESIKREYVFEEGFEYICKECGKSEWA